MSLRQKTLIAVGSCLLILVGAMYGFSKTIITKGFLTLEDRNAHRNIERVRDTMAAEVENLDVKMVDWAQWDDAHQFAVDKNADFIKSNLNDNILDTMKMNVLAFYNTKNELLWGKELDPKTSGAIEINPEFLKYLQDKKMLSFSNPEEKRTGLLYSKTYGPVIITVLPIITSEGKGPIAGTLVAVRWLDQQYIEKLQTITHLKFDIEKFSTEKMGEEKFKNNALIERVNDEKLAGYTFFKDIEDAPAITAKIDMPRDVFSEGNATIFSFLVATLVAGFALGSIIIAILEFQVLRRILGLSKEIQHIDNSGSLSLRVTAEGYDELAHLGNSMNKMLTSIENSKNQISLLLNNAAQGFMSFDSNGIISQERSKAVDTIFGMDPSGMHISELVKGEKSVWDEYVQYIFEETIDFDSLMEICPKEIQLAEKTIEVEYRPVRDQDQKIARVMLVTTDVTSLRVLQKEAETDRKKNLALITILSAKKDFLEVVDMIDDLKRYHHSPAEFKRVLHTIKGGLAFLECRSMAELCHLWETEFTMNEVTPELLAKAEMDIANELNVFMETNSKILNMSKKKEKTIEVEFESLIQLVNSARAIKAPDYFVKDLQKLTEVTTQDAFQWLSAVWEKTAEKLGKEVAPIHWSEDSITICPDHYTNLFKSLVHVVRNAADHGIENPDEREMLGKERLGHMTGSLTFENGLYVLVLKDDGAGADLERVVNKARNNGLEIPAEPEEQIQLLFADGMSTKAEVSEFSGRGVGLDAVRTEARRLNGDARIENSVGEGLKVTITFKPLDVASMLEYVKSAS